MDISEKLLWSFCKGSKSILEEYNILCIKSEWILDINKFLPDRNTVVVFEDLYAKLNKVQDQIVSYFISSWYQGISSIYVSQKYTQTPKIIHENIIYLEA